jgi:UPF0716 protein FxsA
MRFVWLFLLWVMIEIGLFAGLGGYIGVIATWAVVVGSAIGGFLLIRWQKRSVLGQVLQDLQALGDPVTPAAHSALIVLAGVLLILPGFLTDALGLILLIPWVRNQIIGHLRERARLAAMDKAVATMLRPRPRPRDEDVQDAELADNHPASPRPHKPSGWTKP